MNNEAWNGFLQKLTESPELRREFAELSLRHGIDFSGGELSDDEMEAVAGGGDKGSLFMQQTVQNQDQLFQMMSNISKMIHETTTNVIDNIRP